jgi:ethanolamine ammonia-lyase small subunit
MSDLTRIDPAQMITELRKRTPARLLVGHAGPAYPTAAYLELRRDHAAARDAVQTELRLTDLPQEFVALFRLFEIQTQANSKDEYLVRPDRGRRLSGAAHSMLRERARLDCDVQIVIGDGLSATAVLAQVPPLLPLLMTGAANRGWSVGDPFLVRYCRVGVLNDLGDLLNPAVVILLIGERPGLATAESLSAYFAYRPRPGDTDAKRNLISNIHSRGVVTAEAAERILNLAAQLMAQQESGVRVKEQFARSIDPLS